MKVQILLVVILGAVAVKAAVVSRSLQSDFKDFDDLLPKEAVKELVEVYVQTNEDVQAALEFLHGDTFKFEYRKIIGLTVVKNLVDYLQLAGVNVVELLNKFASLLDLEQYTPPKLEGVMDDEEEVTTTEPPVVVDGVDALVEDILKILPQAEAKALFEDKLKSSKAFQKLIEALQTKKFKTHIYYVTNSLKLEKHLKVLRENHIEVNNLVKLVRAFFGYSFEPEIVA